MPRYYFHLHNHVECRDEEGMELADFAAARENAIHNARDVMVDDVRRGEICLSHHVDVHDEADTKLLVMRFGEALSVLP